MAKLATIRVRLKLEFKLWSKRVVAGGLLVALFFVAGGGISQNEKWRIERIEVVGAHAILSDDIVRAVQPKLYGNNYFVYSRKNSLLFPRKEIEQSLLLGFPRLKSVEILRASAHVIEVRINERKPFALWCGLASEKPATACWYTDGTGFIFDMAPIFSEGAYLQLYGFLDTGDDIDPLRKNIPRREFENIGVFVRALASQGIILSRASFFKGGEMSIVIRGSDSYPMLAGVSVRFRNEQNVGVLVKNFMAALPVQFPQSVPLKKKLEYVDLRFGNKVFFGFKN